MRILRALLLGSTGVYSYGTEQLLLQNGTDIIMD